MTFSARATRGLEVALLLLAFGPLLVEWGQTAGASPRLSYALLVPLLAGVLALREARSFPAAPGGRGNGGASPCGAWLALAAAAALFLGTFTGLFTLSLLAFPLALAALVGRWAGRTWLRRLAPGLAFLALMVPPPLPVMDRVNPALIEASGQTAVWLLGPLDPHAAWAGSTLTFRGWTLIVAEACSGSGTFLILFVLCLFLAGLFRMGTFPALALALCSVPLALFGNGLRIAASALLIDAFGPGAASGLPHELLGQLVVIGSAAGLAWLVDRLTRGLPAAAGSNP